MAELGEMVQAQTLLKQFPELLRHVSGSLEQKAAFPCGSDNPQKDGLCFAGDFIEAQNASKIVGILVVPEKIAAKFDKSAPCVLSTPSIQSTMALVNRHFFPTYQSSWSGGSVHATAVVDPSAQLGKNVKVGPFAVIGPKCKIGDNSYVGPHTVLEDGAQIGENSNLEANVFVGRDCVLGKNCRVQPFSVIGTEGFGYGTDSKMNHHRKPHYGRVILGDRVEVGCGVNIDRGTFDDTTIGEGTKIDNHCHIAHNTKIGKNCFLTAGFINAGSVEIGDLCAFGGRANVNGHIKITSGVQVAGASTVHKSVDKAGNYAGYPLAPHKEALRTLTSLSHLTKMRKNLDRVLKKLGLESESED